jgi:hypothetical protein
MWESRSPPNFLPGKPLPGSPRTGAFRVAAPSPALPLFFSGEGYMNMLYSSTHLPLLSMVVALTIRRILKIKARFFHLNQQ